MHVTLKLKIVNFHLISPAWGVPVPVTSFKNNKRGRKNSKIFGFFFFFCILIVATYSKVLTIILISLPKVSCYEDLYTTVLLSCLTQNFYILYSMFWAFYRRFFYKETRPNEYLNKCFIFQNFICFFCLYFYRELNRFLDFQKIFNINNDLHSYHFYLTEKGY